MANKNTNEMDWNAVGKAFDKAAAEISDWGEALIKINDVDRCAKCGKGSSLFIQMVDPLDNPSKWCPACVCRLMKANELYIEGMLKGDQDKNE
jgi:hypothetical protein